MLCSVALHQLLLKIMLTESSSWQRVYCEGFATIIGVRWERFVVQAKAAVVK